MARYDYECPECGDVHEEIHGMTERPKVFCSECNVLCHKLIGMPSVSKDGLWNFVDYNTTGKPVVIRSKSQWQRHLKAHGLNDDCKQSVPRMEDLQEGVKESKTAKTAKREKLRKEIRQVLKDKGVYDKLSGVKMSEIPGAPKSR